MIEGVVYPEFAEHIAEYLATTLYFTSDLAPAGGREARAGGRVLGNTDLCKITEDLVFTDPYMVCSRNRWTSPQLDDAGRRDPWRCRPQARGLRAQAQVPGRGAGPAARRPAYRLDHGDRDDTKVIDPEFAVMGPMGFDVGKLLGNLLLSLFSQRGHERTPGERDAYRALDPGH